ncbi:MAG: C40 family peptidase [Saprospiraceae bacterium]|nr:C40 family peptidase [Saprospiraceae bacterium]
MGIKFSIGKLLRLSLSIVFTIGLNSCVSSHSMGHPYQDSSRIQKKVSSRPQQNTTDAGLKPKKSSNTQKQKNKSHQKTSAKIAKKPEQKQQRILVADTRLDSVLSPPVQTIREKIIREARSLLGTRYKPAGKTPAGFDCSGFVIHVLSRFDFQMAACSADQSKCGRKILAAEAKPGDLIFFGSKDRIHHVGILTEIDDRKMMMIHSSSSKGVIEEDILKSDYWLKRIKMIRDLDSFTRQKGITMN